MASNDASLQMQTPPPTREAAKRKSQQHQIRFATPSTVRSRRQSAPGDAWLKTNIDQTPLDSTPFQAPWAQFSPPDSLAFSSPGPATAPAHPQTNLLWDVDQSSYEFGSLADGATNTSTEMHSFEFTPLSHKLRQAEPFTSPLQPVSNSSSYVRNAQTASLGNSRADRYSFSEPSFVDPSKIWSDNREQVRGIRISGPAARHPRDAPAPPYQFHVEELQREKEQQRRRRESLSRSSHTAFPILKAPARPSLQRSLTDGITGKSFGAATSSDLGEITRGLEGTHIPRHGSPVKRQRLSGGLQSSSSSVSMNTRRSVTLEIDESGRARTVIRHVVDQSTPWQSSITDESEMNDEPSMRKRGHVLSPTGSQAQGSSGTGNPSSAEDALRIMIKGRHQRTHPVADSCDLESAAPMAAEQLTAPTPFTTSAQDFRQTTNCACGNNVANALMIQW